MGSFPSTPSIRERDLKGLSAAFARLLLLPSIQDWGAGIGVGLGGGQRQRKGLWVQAWGEASLSA